MVSLYQASHGQAAKTTASRNARGDIVGNSTGSNYVRKQEEKQNQTNIEEESERELIESPVTNTPQSKVISQSQPVTSNATKFETWASRGSDVSGVLSIDSKKELNINAQQKKFTDIKQFQTVAQTKKAEVQKAVADYAKKGPVQKALSKLYTATYDMKNLNSAVSKVIPSEATIAQKRDAVLSNVSVKVTQPGKQTRQYTLKDVHRKRLEQANSNPITAGAGSLLMEKYNYLDKKPVNAGIDLAKLYVEMQVIGGAVGAVTKVSGKALTGAAWKAKKFTPKISGAIPKSLPRVKAGVGKVDDAISAAEGAVIRHSENTIAPVGIFGAGAYSIGKPISDTYKNKDGAYLNKFDAEKAAVKQAVEALVVLPLGTPGYKAGDKFGRSIIEHSKAIGKGKVKINEIVDPEVLSGRVKESSVPSGDTVQDLIKSAETTEKGVHAGWNAADVPMENYVPLGGKLKSDARPPKIPQKDNSGTFISPEKYGAHIRFVRLADETEAYTTLDVVKAVKEVGKAVKDAIKPSQKSSPVSTISQIYTSKASNEAAVSTSNKVVDVINAVSEVTAKIFGEPEPFDPTISHIRVGEISRHSKEAVKLAQKNPGTKIFKDTKGLHKGLKIAQEDIMSEKAKGKTYVTLAAEKLLKSGASAEPELQIAPNTQFKRVPGSKEKITWYKGRAIKVREYEVVNDIVGDVANTAQIVESSVKSTQGLINRVTKDATREISYYGPTKRGVFYNLKAKYVKVKGGKSGYSDLEYSKSKYSESRYLNNKYSGNKYSGNKYSGNKYSGNKYSGNKYSGNKYSGNKYSGNKYSDVVYPGIKYPSPKYPETKYPSPRYPEIKYPNLKYTGNKYTVPDYPGGKAPKPKPPAPPEPKPIVIKRKKNSYKADAKRLKSNVKLSRKIRNQLGSFTSLFGEYTPKAKPRTSKKKLKVT